jgi:23S rRNA (cytidine1920-2'-O)/16S rRNA (cytidine1409-2'-O)-methyltransferase
MARGRRLPLRSIAQLDPADLDAAVAARRVLVDGRPVLNPNSLVPANAAVTLLPETELRGTAKLDAALCSFGIDCRGRVALDLGAAAGGFTTALLRAGAARVYAVDAGFGQLLGRLRQDPRVVCLERVNVGALGPKHVPEPVSLVTVDLSYVSLATALPQIPRSMLDDAAELVALVKPMFELGIDRPPADPAPAVERAVAGATAAGWTTVAATESPVRGSRGAVEWFLHSKRRAIGR